MIKKRLFTPGPVSVYPTALFAALDSNIHHRTPEFKDILKECMAALKRTLGDPDQVYIFTSSGTGAMEAAITNFFSPADEVFIASCGKFGERWIELANRFGLKTKVKQYPNGEAINPQDIERELKENPRLQGVFLQACESSTGVQNDVEAIASIVQQSNALLIVDAISALATMPLSAKFGIDALVGGSQKALMIPPGLAFVGISEKAWKRLMDSKLPRYYFDLQAARKAWEESGQTPWTPATSLIISLRESLRYIEEIGLEKLIKLTENRARATRAALNALSLEILPKRSPANALTAVVAPNQAAEKITSHMKKRFGYYVAGGQSELKGRIFRISHMGFIDHFDLIGLFSALELTLKSLDHPVTLGSSLQAFQKIYSELA